MFARWRLGFVEMAWLGLWHQPKPIIQLLITCSLKKTGLSFNVVALQFGSKLGVGLGCWLLGIGSTASKDGASLRLVTN